MDWEAEERRRRIEEILGSIANKPCLNTMCNGSDKLVTLAKPVEMWQLLDGEGLEVWCARMRKGAQRDDLYG